MTNRWEGASRAELAAAYVERIGYDPFAEGGGWTEDDARDVLIEYDAMDAGKADFEGRTVAGEGGIQIVEVAESYGPDFYVYRGDTLIRVCPSIGMAREVAAGLE